MYKEAFEEHVKTLQSSGVDAKEIERHRRVYAEKGWPGLDEDYLNWLLGEWEKAHWHFTTFEIAGLYARLGDKDQAFAWLNKSVELRSTILWAIDAAPDFASLRSDPRFTELKAKWESQADSSWQADLRRISLLSKNCCCPHWFQ